MTAGVSVVVITRDRVDGLLHTLDRLATLPERPPVIVVDNGSQADVPAAVARHFPAVEVVALGRNAGAAGRNEGACRAASDLVAFSDDDSWWAPGALRRAEELFASHPRLGLLQGRILVGPGERTDPVCEEMAGSPLGHSPGLPGPALLGFVACGAVVRRAAFLQVGGFNERYLVGGEEQPVAIDLTRAGWHLAYVPDVVAHHHPAARPGRPRSIREVRNDLWTAWLRRPAAAALRRSAEVVAPGWRTPETWRGAAAAATALPWVLRHRRPVPDWLETRIRAVERDHRSRRHVAAVSAQGGHP